MILVALGIFAPFVPVPNMTSAIAGAIALTIVYVVATVLFAAHATRLQLSVRDTTLFFGVAIALWSVLQFAIAPAVFTLFQALRLEGDEPSASQLILLHVTTTLTDVSLLSAAVVGGSLVGRLIRSPNMLGPICAIIALIDVWGVLFGGIVSQLLDKTPQLAATAMATIPSVGSAVASAPGTPSYSIPLPDIGAGDYLFLGLLFFPLHFNRMNWRGAAKLTTPLIALALISIPLSRILLHQNIALPGLLPIGLGVALPNWKYFQFTREEKFALLYAAIFVIILTIALYFGITSQLPDQPPTP